jgi:energy-coupling factor transporter ATP-binding protein EcfA2
MRNYGIELYIEERVRDLLLEAEQERLLRDASPVTRSDGPRRRFSLAAILRRFAQLAWAW